MSYKRSKHTCELGPEEQFFVIMLDLTLQSTEFCWREPATQGVKFSNSINRGSQGSIIESSFNINPSDVIYNKTRSNHADDSHIKSEILMF